MATNIAELGSVYKRIFVLDMIEKMKDCAVVWNQISPYQFSTAVLKDNIIWNVYLTKMPNGSTVTIDFTKAGRFYYSVNSDDDANVEELFNNIAEEDIADKDDALLRDIQQFQGCEPKKYREYPEGGVVVGGRGAFSINQGVSGGVWVAGDSDALYFIHPTTGLLGPLGAGAAAVDGTYNPVITPQGVLADGNYYNIFRPDIGTDGPLAGGAAFDFTTYQWFPTQGVLAAGLGDVSQQMFFVPTQGVLAGGAASSSTEIGITPNGVLAAGSAPNSTEIGVTPNGVLAAGVALNNATFNHNPSTLATIGGLRTNGTASINMNGFEFSFIGAEQQLVGPQSGTLTGGTYPNGTNLILVVAGENPTTHMGSDPFIYGLFNGQIMTLIQSEFDYTLACYINVYKYTVTSISESGNFQWALAAGGISSVVIAALSVTDLITEGTLNVDVSRQGVTGFGDVGITASGPTNSAREAGISVVLRVDTSVLGAWSGNWDELLHYNLDGFVRDLHIMVNSYGAITTPTISATASAGNWLGHLLTLEN